MPQETLQTGQDSLFEPVNNAEKITSLHKRTMLLDGSTSRVFDEAETLERYGIPGNTVAEIRIGYASRFAIVDISKSSQRAGDLVVFGDMVMNAAATPLVLVSRGLDMQKGVGFKAIRPSEEISVGRDKVTARFGLGSGINERDVSDRFRRALQIEMGEQSYPDTSISEEHFSVTLDQKSGRIIIADSSKRGTEITTKSFTDSGSLVKTPTIGETNEVVDEQTKVQNAFAELLASGNSTESVRALLERGLKPVEFVEAGGRPFFISPIMNEGRGRKLAVIMYTEKDERTLVPRLAYKSNSAGGWRVATFIDDQGRYVKGSDKVHYTQEGKLVDGLTSKLEEMESNPSLLDPTNSFFSIADVFVRDTQEKEGTLTYEQEHTFVQFDKKTQRMLDVFKPGYGFEKSDNPARYFETQQLPQEYVPDFGKPPVLTTTHEHSILGAVTFETFETDGDVSVYSDKGTNHTRLQWTMAHDSAGRVWIDTIATKQEGVTSYGTRPIVLDSGLLTQKPIEYLSQLDGLNDGDYAPLGPEHPEYADITPLIDRLPVVRQYRQARAIERAAA